MSKYFNKEDLPDEPIHIVIGRTRDGEVHHLEKELQTAIDICNNKQKEIVRLNDENRQYKEYIKELKDSLMNYHIKNNKLINKNEKLNNIINKYNRTRDELIKKLDNLFLYGDEWHWDDGGIRSYVEDIYELITGRKYEEGEQDD